MRPRWLRTIFPWIKSPKNPLQQATTLNFNRGRPDKSDHRRLCWRTSMSLGRIQENHYVPPWISRTTMKRWAQYQYTTEEAPMKTKTTRADRSNGQRYCIHEALVVMLKRAPIHEEYGELSTFQHMTKTETTLTELVWNQLLSYVALSSALRCFGPHWHQNVRPIN